MARRKRLQPTEAELEVLQVLWEKGPSTVRQINEALNRSKPTGYTTTLKVMQRMTEKGLITPDQSERTYVYSANLSQEKAQQQMVRKVVQGVMGGSAQKLILHALGSERMSAEELAEVEKAIRRLKGEKS